MALFRRPAWNKQLPDDVMVLKQTEYVPVDRNGILAILPAVRRFAFSQTGNMSDADDLMQTAVERLLERGAPADANLLHWTLRVVRNLWIDEVRAASSRNARHERSAETAPTYVDGEQAVLDARRVEEVSTAMAGLPEPQRAVLGLVVVEGLSYEECARVLEIPVGTVMSRLARARAALVQALAEPR